MRDTSSPFIPSAHISAEEAQSTTDYGQGYLATSKAQLKKQIAEQAKKGIWEVTKQMCCLGTCAILKRELEELGYTVKISRYRPSLYALTVFWFPSDSILEIYSQFETNEDVE